MVRIERIVNSVYKSNTYVLWSESSCDCYLIDCGDPKPVKDFTDSKRLSLRGVFFTHGHFDHIYGINDIVSIYDGVRVFVSEYTLSQLMDDRLNYSRYHNKPLVYSGSPDSIAIVSHGDVSWLWPDESPIVSAFTPGHDMGCMSYILDKYLFSGDAYIPGVKTVVNLRGDKDLAKSSEALILKECTERSLCLCPGHGKMFLSK